jgi:hypothetical protein
MKKKTKLVCGAVDKPRQLIKGSVKTKQQTTQMPSQNSSAIYLYSSRSSHSIHITNISLAAQTIFIFKEKKTINVNEQESTAGAHYNMNGN